MNAKKPARRQFLKEAALAGLATGAMQSASGQTPTSAPPTVRPEDTRAYGERSRFENSARKDSHTPLQDSVGIITPSPLHYVVSHGYPPPDIDPRQHRLLIHGMAYRPLLLTLEELQRLPSVSRVHFIECN